MATRTLYLVRHGLHQTQTMLAEGPNAGLTLLGVEQALFTAQRFRALPITEIHYSPLTRAAETADIIARALPDAALHKSLVLQECIPSIPPTYEGQMSYSKERLKQCEQQFQKAFAQFFKSACGEDKHALLVCHGNIIRYLILQTLGVSTQAWNQMDMCNCGVSEVIITPNGDKMLVAHNDVRHLPAHLTTSLIGERRAKTFFQLAKIACQRSDPTEAQMYAEASLELYEIAGHGDAERVRHWMAEICGTGAVGY